MAKTKHMEVALIHTPGEGLRLQLPADEDGTSIGFGGNLLFAIHTRLQVDPEWRKDLTHWMNTELFPQAVVH
jgi:hypothetical protein